MHDKSNALAAMIEKMAHDLRTPLAVVHTTTNMLLNPRYQLSPEQVRDQHERIRRNAEIMNRLIGELADLAQLSTGTLHIDAEPVSVSEVLRDAVAARDSQALEAGIVLSNEGSAEAPPLQADRARLLQMFESVIRFSINTTARGSQLRVSSQLHDSAVSIGIEASGIAMTPLELSQLLEPSSAPGKRAPKNAAGFGLFIAKGIAEAHGGSLRCIPAASGDTVFSISLPLKP